MGYQNERVRYNNYVWQEAVSAVPNAEIPTTRQGLERKIGQAIHLKQTVYAGYRMVTTKTCFHLPEK